MPTQNVLITGGTGFVGYWMKKTCPADVCAYYMDKDGYNSNIDFCMREWDAIVHLAPVAPTKVIETAWGQHDINPRILFASSGAAYDQNTEYADDKRRWEDECLASEEDVVIARLFTFIGSHLNGNFAVKNFIEAARNRKPMIVQGNGSTVRSYLYGSDLGRWMWTILMKGELDTIYDVGSFYPVTILQLAQTIAEVAPTPIHILNDDHIETNYVPHTEKAIDLGCKEEVTLSRAIINYLWGNE